MKRTLFTLMTLTGLLVFISSKAQAQTEQDLVKKAIQTMFDGMRAGDSSMVHSVFTDAAVMETIAANKQGEVSLRKGSLKSFLDALGTPHDQVWNEQILSYEIKIDGDMASVWTPYEFYAGDNFSHCGVNSFQLMKTASGWKVIYLVDTRRREGCK